MAYEIGGGGTALTPPNPFRTHNVFLSLSALIVGSGAIWLIFDIRRELWVRHVAGVVYTLGLAMGMLIVAVSMLYVVLTQLRFYFDRGWPGDLTGTMDPEQIKDAMRAQTLVYNKPLGPIDGALFAAVPNLMYAPPPIRYLARWHFKICVTLVVFFLSLVLILLLRDSRTVSGTAITEYFGFGFLAYAIYLLVRPSPDFATWTGKADVLSVQRLSLLVVIVLVGPLAITMLTPPIWLTPSEFIGLSPFPHVFIFLSLAFGLFALFLVALIRQLPPPPTTLASSVQEAWNISCDPALVMGEFGRAMQDGWTDKIPNREYLKVLPDVQMNQGAGSFFAESVEETQPLPRTPSNTDMVGRITQRSTVLCVVLDACGLAFMAGFTFAACVLGHKLLAGIHTPRDTGDITLCLLYAVILGTLGQYALSTVHHLWSRFDFESKMIWLEMSGQYITGRVEQGDPRHGLIRVGTSMIRVEAMTFRLSAAEIHTMTFGKGSRRFIVSMAGDYEIAEALTQRLKTFASSQASVAELGNEANQQRLANIAILSESAGKSPKQVVSPPPMAILPGNNGGGAMT